MTKFFISAFLLAAMYTQGQEGSFTVYFPFNKDIVTHSSAITLKEWIQNHKDVSITIIEGYTDKTGKSVYNLDLSERRIKYIKNVLREEQLNLESVKIIPFGETKAVAPHSAPDRKVTVFFKENKVDVISEPPVKVEQTSDFTKKMTTASKGDKIRVPNLNFYNNSDIVLPASIASLKELLKILQDNPSLRIDIQGHICCQKIETDEISKKRAYAVYKFLIMNGIEKSRLSYQSFGSSRPIYPLPEKNEDERVANRRVEVEILSE